MDNRKNDNLIFGIRAIIETIDSGEDIEKLFIQKNLKGDLIKELQDALRNTDIPQVRVPIERLNKFTRKNHQGVVGFRSPVKYLDLPEVITSTFEKGNDPFVFVLDRITDVRNFGAIARSAECMGATTLVIPTKNAAQVNGDALKTSAGALAKISICRQQNITESVRFLKNAGCTVVGCTEKGTKSIADQSLQGPVAIVMGSEEDGISPEILKICDELVHIPMSGKITSLNVSAAAAICAYEVQRQRG